MSNLLRTLDRGRVEFTKTPTWRNRQRPKILTRHRVIRFWRDATGKLWMRRGLRKAKKIGAAVSGDLVKRISRWRVVVIEPSGSRVMYDLKRNRSWSMEK